MVIKRNDGEERSREHAIPPNFFVEIEYVGPIAWNGSTNGAPTPGESQSIKHKLALVEKFANAVSIAILKDHLGDTIHHPSSELDLNQLASVVAHRIIRDAQG